MAPSDFVIACPVYRRERTISPRRYSAPGTRPSYVGAPEVALFVNEPTLLPLLIPVAPARTLLDRLPAAVAELLDAHLVPRELIDSEVAEIAGVRVAPTANRSVVGVMNELGFLANAFRDQYFDDSLGLLVRLAATPCSPLYRRNISPDRELAAFVAKQTSR